MSGRVRRVNTSRRWPMDQGPRWSTYRPVGGLTRSSELPETVPHAVHADILSVRANSDGQLGVPHTRSARLPEPFDEVWATHSDPQNRLPSVPLLAPLIFISRTSRAPEVRHVTVHCRHVAPDMRRHAVASSCVHSCGRLQSR